MKHASSRALFRYWNECRGQRLAPERDDIDPGALCGMLGDSLVLAIDGPTRHPFRLAGTRLCALFCRELRTEPFANLWDAASRASIDELIETITSEAVGVVAGATGAGGDAVALELMLLPLTHRGRLDLRMIGVLAPLAVPYWLGARPIGTLTLGGFRHVGPATEPMRGRPLVPTLRTIEGGRGL